MDPTNKSEKLNAKSVEILLLLRLRLHLQFSRQRLTHKEWTVTVQDIFRLEHIAPDLTRDEVRRTAKRFLERMGQSSDEEEQEEEEEFCTT